MKTMALLVAVVEIQFSLLAFRHGVIAEDIGVREVAVNRGAGKGKAANRRLDVDFADSPGTELLN